MNFLSAEEDGGVCIISTHLGKGFAPDGQLSPAVDEVLEYLAGRPGWFVPVSELLDHLAQRSSGRELRSAACLRLELRFLADQIRSRLRD